MFFYVPEILFGNTLPAVLTRPERQKGYNWRIAPARAILKANEARTFALASLVIAVALAMR